VATLAAEGFTPRFDDVAPDDAPRIGRLAEELRAETPVDPPWLVPGMIYLGGTTELNGREKSGKGFFESYLLGALERDDPTVLGNSTIGPVRSLIYTEEPVQSLKEKFDLFDLKRAMVVYHWELAHLPWDQVILWLVDNAVRLECKMIFVDNISAATNTQDEAGVELSNKVRPLSAKAKELELAILFDRHQRKAPGKVEDLSRGSTSLAGAVDNIVALQKDGQGRERKLTSWGRLMACNWERQIELTEDWTNYNLLEGDYRQRMLMQQGAWTAKAFAKVINTTEDTAHAYLSEHPLVEKRERAADKGAHLYLVNQPPEIS
jgi:hypothetical protein